jgi:hypothetical protein
MTTYEIPLSAGAQSFNARIFANVYRLRLLFADGQNPCWLLDIGDQDGVDLVCGIPVIPGADLLAQYPEIGFGFSLKCAVTKAPDAVPQYADMGDTMHLYVEG